jgi:hypothetical protein
MVLSLLALVAVACLSPVVYAQELNNSSLTASLDNTVYGQNPLSDKNGKICVFITDWILRAVFMVVLLVFLTGVAIISGAAFPEWRNYGSKMILGSIGAVFLYIIGIAALKFLMGMSLCGL